MSHLQRASLSDLNELRSWIQRYFSHDGLIFNDAVSAGVEELLLHQEYGAAFFVLVDSRIVGYAVITYGFDHEVGGRLGVVTDLYLEEGARGKGLGRKTLNQLIEFAGSEGLRSIELWVLEHNSDGKRFYESLGFRSTADRNHMHLSI